MTIATGDALARLVTSLTIAFEAGEEMQIEPLPKAYERYRSELGHEIYGEHGYNLPREDTEGYTKAVLQNFRFYGAPMVAIVCIDQVLARADVLSTGMYLQLLTLLLAERGLGTCVEGSPVGYPKVIRKELGIPENMTMLCAIAIGYEDNVQPINKLKMPRDAWQNNVRFVDDEVV